MKTLVSLITGFFLLIFYQGCGVQEPFATSNDNDGKVGCEIIIRVIENENFPARVQDVFINADIKVINMQQIYLSQQQIEYRILCRPVDYKKLSEMRELLLADQNVLNIYHNTINLPCK